MEKKQVNYILAFGSIILTVILVEFVYELRASNSTIPLLGVLPNFIAATFGIFIFIPFVRGGEAVKYSFFYSLGLTLYEVLQINIPNQTFDLFDVVATWLGFVVSVFLFKGVISISQIGKNLYLSIRRASSANDRS